MSDGIAVMQHQHQQKDTSIFTHRESQCLIKILQGNCLSDISISLNITPRTVYFHVNSIRKKFELLTKQLMQIAI